MKIRTAISLLFIILAASCNFASFTDRPGVQVESFPASMHGTYRYIEKHKGISDTHVLHINAGGAELNDPVLGQFFNPQDSNKSLSHLGDYYYLNIRSKDSSKVSYFIYPFEVHKNNILVYKLLLSKKNIRRMEKSGLKPSGRKQGEYTMENEAFKHYVEKHLKSRDAIKFTKIKS